jgi:hypothetical protein
MSSGTTTAAARARDFVGTLGVNTHLEYTDGLYVNYQQVITDLNYLGINQVRDGTPNPSGGIPYQDYETSIAAATAAGIKFDFITGPGEALSTTMSQIDAIAKAHPGSVLAVEGPNEINNFPVSYNGMSGDPAAQAYQKALYAAVKSDPNLTGTSVYYYTGYGMVDPTPLNPATTPGYADYDNQHPYPQNGVPPSQAISRSIDLSNENPPTGPAVYTEAGYSTTGIFNGPNADVQAKYTLDMLFDDAAAGISKTYLYQLLDAYAPGSPQGDDGFGLFDYTGAAKPAATAIHNLTTILSDAGSNATSFTPGTLGYSVSGLPSTGSSYLMEKSSGAFDIVVWNEPQIWNSSTKTEITASSTPVTVNLGQTFGTVQVFDPMQGTSPVQTLSNASSAQVALTDHPLIIQASSPATVSGDTLTLHLSEDAYSGDAQFVAKIDGTQIAGPTAVTTLHSSGNSEAFTYTGNWGPGLHDLEIDFVNDAYGGSPSLDRNLYVNQVSYDGANALPSNGVLSMFGNGAAQIAIGHG